MKFVFGGKAMRYAGVSRWGFHAWLNRSPSARSRSDEELGGKVKASFMASDRTYCARRVWRDLLADGADCGLHQIERRMRLQGLRARTRRRRLPKDSDDRQLETVPANLLDRQFAAAGEPEVDRRLYVSLVGRGLVGPGSSALVAADMQVKRT
ncbi:transposase InsO family protein [Bradyrhizobium sp. cir1]|nr:transposase InsO family protein [Bradyrhizobium sp. cir1]